MSMSPGIRSTMRGVLPDDAVCAGVAPPDDEPAKPLAEATETAVTVPWGCAVHVTVPFEFVVSALVPLQFEARPPVMAKVLVVAFVEKMDDQDILRRELTAFREGRAEGSWENFLYFVARIYFDARGSDGAADRRASEREAGVTHLRSTTALRVPAQIIPLANSGQETAVRTFNAAIPGIVQSKANSGKHVHAVDMHSALTPADLTDGIAPRIAIIVPDTVSWTLPAYEIAFMTAAMAAVVAASPAPLTPSGLVVAGTPCNASLSAGMSSARGIA